MSEKKQISFDAIVQTEGSFTFVAIPFSPREFWGEKPRYYVKGTINEAPVRGTLGVFKKEFFLRLSRAWMRSNGIESGANVSVQLSLEDRNIA